MKTKTLKEIHPCEILLEEFMRPMGISARQLSSGMDVPPSHIKNVVNGARPVSAETAIRLFLFFSMDVRFWTNLQSEYDVRVARQDLLEKIIPRVRVFQAA